MTDLQTVVLKFGGTSVRDAGAMRRVVQITESQRAMGYPVVVTSACAGVTDQLLACARTCGDGDLNTAFGIAHQLRERHLDILSDLSPPDPESSRTLLMNLLDEIGQLCRGVVLLSELTPRSLDAFASYGERLSSVLLAAAFRAAGRHTALADSRTFIITDDRFTQARPLMDHIDQKAPQSLLPCFLEYEVVVTQGFIGSTADGITTTIGRGGSDHTGALVGAALGSAEIQIWTDVSGILTADPRVVPWAHVVPEVTFSEARSLAYFGAKVIHPDTILPAVERNIPVVIKNSMKPSDRGTRILPDGASVQRGVHSITTKNDVTALWLTPRNQADATQALDNALRALHRHQVPVFCAQRAESKAVLAVPTAQLTELACTAVEACCTMTARDNVTLLCLSGDDLLGRAFTLAGPLGALADMQILFVAAGASQHIYIIGLDSADAPNALQAVHRQLFK